MKNFHVILDEEIWGYGYLVVVRPVPGEVGHDRHFMNLKEARMYAQHLSRATGWSVHDMIEDDLA